MANSLGTLTLDLVAKIGGFTQQMDRAASATEKSMKQIEAASNQAKLAVNSMFAVVAGGLSVSSLKSAADSFTELNNRLRLVTSSSVELGQAQSDIYRISQAASQSMDTTAQIYQRFAQNAKELGINLNQVSRLTETISKAGAISGSSQESLNAALVQLGQALASGVLRGEEFNSVMEQASGIAKYLAEGLGVPFKELRALANEGQLTTDKLVSAFTKVASKVDSDFSTLQKTVGQSLTNLKNAFTIYVGEADKAWGVSQTLSQSILFLSDNLDTVFNAGLLIAGTRLGAFTVSLGESAVASLNSARANLSEAAAKRESTLATIADTQAKIASIQSERAFAIAVQQSLAAQLQATQAEVARNAIRQQMKSNSAQIVALTNAETAATTKLAAAQSSVAGLGRSLFTALGGLSGLGAVAGLAATAWALFSRNSDEARVSLDAMSGSIDDVKRKLDEMTVSQASAFKLGIDNKIKELNDQQQETIRLLGESLTARTSTINDATGEIVYNQDVLTAINQLKEVAQTGGDTATAINDLKTNFGNLIPQDLLDKLTTSAGKVDDLKSQIKVLNEQSEAASNRLREGADSAREFGDALAGAFNPQQIKGLEGLQKQLDDQILRLRDKTGRLTLEAKIKAIVPNGAVTPEDKKLIDQLYKSLNERNALQSSGSGANSAVKSENDLARAYQSQVDQLTKQLVLVDNKNEAQKLAYEYEYGNLTKLNQAQRDTLEALAFEVDLRNEVAKAAKTQAEQQEWIIALNEQIDARRRDANLDVASIGMGSKQFDEYKELIAIQEDYAKKRQSLAKELGKPDGLTQEQYQARISALQQAQNTEVAIVEDAQNRKREAESNWLNGATRSYQDYLDEANNVAKQTESLFTNAFGNMENSLVSFVREGKLSFKSFADAILDDLARIGVRMASSAALEAVLKGIGGLFTTKFSGTGGAPSWATNPLPKRNALGGVYSQAGVQAFANGGAFTNSIVNKPTLFPFAKGTGLMGEAGPEAIMPLTRTADGSLGVRMITDQIGQSTGSSSPQVNIVINSDGSGGVDTSQGYEAMGQEMYRQIQMIADDRIMYQKRQGGMLDPNSRRNQ